MPKKKSKFLDKFSDLQKAVVAIVVIIGMTASAMGWFHVKFATAETVKRIEQQQTALKQSIDYMQLAQQKSIKEARLYVISDRHECEDLTFKNCGIALSKTTKEEIIQLKKDIEDEDRKMKELEIK